jgi:hypothetical protein
VDFGTNSNTLGKVGEELTRADLEDRGYRVVSEQAQIQLPGHAGKYFKPDFIAIDPAGNVVLVESKMGSGAKFTPNQLVGYEQYAKGTDDDIHTDVRRVVGGHAATPDAVRGLFVAAGGG